MVYSLALIRFVSFIHSFVRSFVCSFVRSQNLKILMISYKRHCDKYREQRTGIFQFLSKYLHQKSYKINFETQSCATIKWPASFSRTCDAIFGVFKINSKKNIYKSFKSLQRNHHAIVIDFSQFLYCKQKCLKTLAENGNCFLFAMYAVFSGSATSLHILYHWKSLRNQKLTRWFRL